MALNVYGNLKTASLTVDNKHGTRLTIVRHRSTHQDKPPLQYFRTCNAFAKGYNENQIRPRVEVGDPKDKPLLRIFQCVNGLIEGPPQFSTLS